MNPALRFVKQSATALSTTIGYLRDGMAHLGPEDDWIEGLKLRLAQKADKFIRPLGRPIVFEAQSEDYFGTVEASTDKVEAALMPRYQRNFASTKKYRMIGGKKQWAVGSFVYDPEDTEWQHHVYLFEIEDGTGCQLYGHKETSAEYDPYGHLTDEQYHGDPDGITRGELDKAGVEYA
jgi:hypothetical protein